MNAKASEAKTDDAKKARRAMLLKQRAALTEQARTAADAAIAAQVAALPEFEQADVLLAYLSFGSEIDTREIIRHAWSQGKTVALPRCTEGTRDMRWFKVVSFDGLVKSRFGVDEPAVDPSLEVDPATLTPPADPKAPHSANGLRALALVPGLEFDLDGYRLGYGGGFYDVFLSAFGGASAGLCRNQFLRTCPLERGAYDLPVGIVITQDQVIRVR